MYLESTLISFLKYFMISIKHPAIPRMRPMITTYTPQPRRGMDGCCCWHTMMIVIRMYTGGYHADTHLGCNICYCGVFLISLIILRIQMLVKGDVLTWIIAAAGYLIIVLNAPLEHHNKRLTIEQKHKYMIISTMLGISSMLISFMLNIMGMVIRYGEYTILCHISLYINTMLLIIGLLLLLGMRKEGRFHETDS